ncbi:hypothetical protein [Streptomyces sp. 6N223]|uniref:hypothetical protein n=1 Tax=Streptomyces sp. 6N223 TaxID=3457412 RepID=UPI003FCFAA9F
MNRGRRCVAATAAAVVLAAGVVVGMVHLVLGMAVDRQEMEVAGLSTTAMSLSTWTAGGLLAAFLLLCAGLLGRTCVTDRPPGRGVRALLVGAAALHAVLATLAVGLAGWLVFGGLMLVFGLILLTLTLYPSAPAASTASGPQVGDGDAELGEQPA